MDNKSDLQKFIDLYTSIGIKCNSQSNIDGSFTLSFGQSCCDVNSPNGKKFGEYYFFYTVITFDKFGKFIKQLFFE